MSFPINLAAAQDSKYFTEKFLSKSVKGELEGGYEHVRPRTTRQNRRVFQTGFTMISDALKVELENFFLLKGDHTAFVYTHPVTNVTYSVRFQTDLTITYAGGGNNPKWSINTIEMKEV